MSFAPRDSHEAQVQFALERGIPAIIGVLGTVKLPYPSRAFDMAHCSRCLINWSKNGKKIEEMLFYLFCSFFQVVCNRCLTDNACYSFSLPPVC